MRRQVLRHVERNRRNFIPGPVADPMVLNKTDSENEEGTQAQSSSENPASETCACGNTVSKNSDSGESSSGNSNPTLRLRSLKCCLKQSFKAIYMNERYCDVHFVVGQEPLTQRIPAHKLVLSVRSEVFDTMFDKNWSANSTEIVVPDIEPPAFIALLKFLYTDDVTITPDTVIAILNAAKKYQVHALENQCVNFLTEKLCPENAFKILKEATLFDEPKLVESCLEVIDQNTSAALNAEGFTDIDLGILCSVLERDTLNVKEVNLFEAVVRWSKAECSRKELLINPENQQAVLGAALFSIRFPLMSAEDFASKVARSTLLSDKELVSMFLYFAEKKKPAVNFNTTPRNYRKRSARKSHRDELGCPRIYPQLWGGTAEMEYDSRRYVDDHDSSDGDEEPVRYYCR